MTNAALEDEFNRDMQAILAREPDLGFHSSRFRQMLELHGGVETARLLLRQSPPENVFGYLRERGRLDLTMEYYVVMDKYKKLFTESEEANAKWRLESCPDKL